MENADDVLLKGADDIWIDYFDDLLHCFGNLRVISGDLHDDLHVRVQILEILDSIQQPLDKPAVTLQTKPMT